MQLAITQRDSMALREKMFAQLPIVIYSKQKYSLLAEQYVFMSRALLVAPARLYASKTHNACC